MKFSTGGYKQRNFNTNCLNKKRFDRFSTNVSSTISFNITDDDNDKIKCYIGNYGECGNACNLPEDFFLDKVHWVND